MNIGIKKGTRGLWFNIGCLSAAYYVTYPLLEILQGRIPYDSWKLILHLFAIIWGSSWFFHTGAQVLKGNRTVSGIFNEYWNFSKN